MHMFYGFLGFWIVLSLILFYVKFNEYFNIRKEYPTLTEEKVLIVYFLTVIIASFILVSIPTSILVGFYFIGYAVGIVS